MNPLQFKIEKIYQII